MNSATSGEAPPDMTSTQTNTSSVSKISGIKSQKSEMNSVKSGEAPPDMTSTQNTPTPVSPKVKAPKKKSKAVLEMETMKEKMMLMEKALVQQQEYGKKQRHEKEKLEEEMRIKEEVSARQKEVIAKQDELLLKASQPKKGGKPKAEVQHQPHFRFRTIKTDDDEQPDGEGENVLMLDSDEGREILLYDTPVEDKALLERMMKSFEEEYSLWSEDSLFSSDGVYENFTSDLHKGERDIFFLKDRTKLWNEMSREELIEICKEGNNLNDYKFKDKDAMVEPSWAKTDEGVWVRWGKGTLYGLKKGLLGATLKPKVAINIKSAEGRKQIKTAPEESRCEANASKKAGRCCKEAVFHLPSSGDYQSRQVCITHMKAVHQTSIICKKSLAFGCRWGWFDKGLMCLTVGETKKSIDQYCKDKLKATPKLEEAFKQIKGNSYTEDDVGNSEGYKQLRIN